MTTTGLSEVIVNTWKIILEFTIEVNFRIKVNTLLSDIEHNCLKDLKEDVSESSRFDSFTDFQFYFFIPLRCEGTSYYLF